MSNNIVQLKLSSGDEIICEVMEWPDSNGNEMIIRNAMTMTYSFDMDNEALYGLKPWFTMVESAEEYIIININHVTGTAKPNPSYHKEYQSALNHMHSLSKKRKIERDREALQQEKRFLDALENVTMNISDDDYKNLDSSSNNIIPFPKDTVH
tara:strand:- start:3204 stop:3662 length:459 start_codon:yes stop_codon:yes gene_type:complete